MGFFDRKIKKEKESEFKLNSKMHNKLIEKANCRYIKPPFHFYVKLVRDLDNKDEVNLFKTNINKHGFPDIIKSAQEINWQYLNVDELYSEGNVELLKILDEIYDTNFFYKSRVAGKKGSVIKDFNLNEKNINNNDREKPKNLNMKSVIELAKNI